MKLPHVIRILWGKSANYQLRHLFLRMIKLFAFLTHKALNVLNFRVTAFKNLLRRNVNYSPLKIIITMLGSILGLIFNSRPPDYLGDSCPDGGAGAHWTRLMGGVQNTITQILTAKFPCR